MSSSFAADAGIVADASPALPTRDEALLRTPVEQLAMDGPPRVRAPERATRSANGSVCSHRERTVESSARKSPGGRRRRSEKRLQFAPGGPGPLTEDRQKPECRQARLVCGVARQLYGRLGTRNTVPSIAFVRAERAFRCAGRGGPRRPR
jgi:hypothetical protein